MTTSEEFFDCIICLETSQDERMCITCSKLFCLKCIQTWLIEQSVCPHCRAPLRLDALVKVRWAAGLKREFERLQAAATPRLTKKGQTKTTRTERTGVKKWLLNKLRKPFQFQSKSDSASSPTITSGNDVSYPSDLHEPDLTDEDLQLMLAINISQLEQQSISEQTDDDSHLRLAIEMSQSDQEEQYDTSLQVAIRESNRAHQETEDHPNRVTGSDFIGTISRETPSPIRMKRENKLYDPIRPTSARFSDRDRVYQLDDMHEATDYDLDNKYKRRPGYGCQERSVTILKGTTKTREYSPNPPPVRQTRSVYDLSPKNTVRVTQLNATSIPKIIGDTEHCLDNNFAQRPSYNNRRHIKDIMGRETSTTLSISPTTTSLSSLSTTAQADIDSPIPRKPSAVKDDESSRQSQRVFKPPPGAFNMLLHKPTDIRQSEHL